VQYHAPVVFIVFRNSEYSALKAFCDFTQVGRNVPGMNLPGIDIVKIAQGYGMNAQEIASPQDLEPAFRKAFGAHEPRLICVNVASSAEKCMGMDQSVDPPGYR
jgi:benzoylformate decarboxylase